MDHSTRSRVPVKKKIVILGDYFVGKTSFIGTAVYATFQSSKVGEIISSFNLHLDENRYRFSFNSNIQR